MISSIGTNSASIETGLTVTKLDKANHTTLSDSHCTELDQKIETTTNFIKQCNWDINSCRFDTIPRCEEELKTLKQSKLKDETALQNLSLSRTGRFFNWLDSKTGIGFVILKIFLNLNTQWTNRSLLKRRIEVDGANILKKERALAEYNQMKQEMQKNMEEAEKELEKLEIEKNKLQKP